MDDRKKILFRKYYNSILEIYRSSQNGVITTLTSGGLRKSTTPTSYYIDNIPDTYNPMDDLGVD